MHYSHSVNTPINKFSLANHMRSILGLNNTTIFAMYRDFKNTNYDDIYLRIIISTLFQLNFMVVLVVDLKPYLILTLKLTPKPSKTHCISRSINLYYQAVI